jgi:aerobic C4-dicarboxylate transport protein
MRKPKLYQHLYFQVIVGIVLGVLLGHFAPQLAIKMEPFSIGFIKLIRMLVGPIILTTVISGITKMRDIKEVGRIGIKALVYFEVLTTLALIIGLIVGNLYQPGSGLHINPATLNQQEIAAYTSHAEQFNWIHFVLNIIPETLLSALTKAEMLPILFIAILLGFALLQGGEKTTSLITINEQFSTILFIIVGYVMKLAPLGAFGAMSFTIGKHGIGTLIALSHLVFAVYFTSLLFIFIVLGSIARLFKFSLWRFLSYIKEELLIVLGTSSSEVALPRMVSKLEQLGCGETVVGLVLPTGYTFNLDGTCIYLTIATLFIAQAFNIDLSLSQQVFMIAILALTSKGAAAVTGGGFIVLAATLSSLHTIPVEGLVLLLGVDRFMSEARSLTNLIGNGVATIVISKWEGDFDEEMAKKNI